MTKSYSPAVTRFAELEPAPLPAGRLPATTNKASAWLWHGLIRPGNVSLLTSQWKTGKTTLLAALLARLKQGGELAGLKVRKGRAVVVSEEAPMLWRARHQRHKFGTLTRFFCRPFSGKPSVEQWAALIDRLDRLRAKDGLDLAVIDTLAAFLPAGAESQPDRMLALLQSLEKLTRAGVAVLLLHHPAKGATRHGQAARGTGAIGGYVDVLIEMGLPANAPPDDRRRRLLAWSRYEETPRELVIELLPGGRDYKLCPVGQDDSLEQGLLQICTVLVNAEQQMPRDEIMKSWPEPRKPCPATLWKWLEAGVKRGMFERRGSGQRGDPFRYMMFGAKLRYYYDPMDLIGHYWWK